MYVSTENHELLRHSALGMSICHRSEENIGGIHEYSEISSNICVLGPVNLFYTNQSILKVKNPQIVG